MPDLELCFQHMFCGCLPMLIALTFFFLILHLCGKRFSSAHIILTFVFCFYLIGILTVTGIWWIKTFSPNFVWIPFVDMVRGPLGTILNVLLFIPLGFFLPLLYEGFDRVGRTILAGFLISLCIETVQMFGCGSSDINDLITNTAGTCLGYYVFVLLQQMIPKSWWKAVRTEGAFCYIQVAIYWVISVIFMVTVQQTVFHGLFR